MLELHYQGWTGVVLPVELAEDLGYLAPIKLKWIGNTISGPQDIQTVVTGDIDFGTAFNGAIVKLIATKAPVRVVVASQGVDEKNCGGFYVVESSPIKTARDLVGKTIAINTLGAHHEFILREYLSRNGLTPEETKQVTLVAVPPVSGEQTLRQKQVDVVSLSGINRHKALERGAIRMLFSDYDLYGEFTSSSYVLTNEFIRGRPNTTRKFVEAIAQAIEWERTTPREEVQARFARIIAHRGRNEDVSLVKYWQSVSVHTQGGLIRDKDFQIWIDWLLARGEIKSDQIKVSNVYTNEFNPYRPIRL